MLISIQVIAKHGRVGDLVTTESQIAMFTHCMDDLSCVVDSDSVKTGLCQVSIVCVFTDVILLINTVKRHIELTEG